jgi:glycosyltransferase involved in cell wall biosynthesis
MRSVILCPFNLDQLTGTPARTKSTIKAVHGFCYTTAIANAGTADADEVLTLGKGTGFFGFTWKAWRALRKHKPDVVHAVTTVAVAAALLYRITNKQVQVIFESHGWSWYETEGKNNLLVRWVLSFLDSWGINAADRVIAMSHSQKEFFVHRGIPEEKIHVIWGPIDTVRIYTERNEERITVGYLGNASWWQGVPILIEAASMLAHDDRFTFKLAGFDPEAVADVSIPTNVELVGKVQAKDVQDVLATCDILVSPRREGKASDLQYPQKLSSYLAAGRPVIVSSTNDQPYIAAHAKCGFVLENLSAEEISNALLAFAELSLEERYRMGRTAYGFAQEHFMSKAFAQKVASAYKLDAVS